MTPYHKRPTPITKRMAEDMLVRNLAVRTIDTYTYHVDRFARHFGKCPKTSARNRFVNTNSRRTSGSTGAADGVGLK